MADYMERFGFYEDPPLDYPDDQMVAERRRKGRQAARDADRDGRRRPRGDRAGRACGHAAADGEVAQTIANGGVRMKPRLVDRGRRPRRAHGRRAVEPEEAARVMSSETADELTAMMKQSSRRARAPRPRSRASRSPARPAPPRSTCQRAQPAVVHRLRPADARGRGRRRRARAGRHGRHGRRADRQAGPGVAGVHE